MSRLAATTDIDWFTDMPVGGQRAVNQLVAEQLDPILRRGHGYRVREFCQPLSAHVVAVIGAEYGTTADSLGLIVYRLAMDSYVQVKPCGEPWLIPDADHCVITPEHEDSHQTMSTHPDNNHFFIPKVDPTGLDDELSGEVADLQQRARKSASDMMRPVGAMLDNMSVADVARKNLRSKNIFDEVRNSSLADMDALVPTQPKPSGGNDLRRAALTI